MSLIYPVILSGGAGSRLWPLSRAQFPKPLLALTSEHSLIQETALRTRGPNFARPVIVCNVEHRFLVAEQMRGAGIAPLFILLEPSGRNTAPAAAVAALKIIQTDPEAILLLMPADHVIKDLNAFGLAVERARVAADGGYLVTFGIKATTPETGYGYIKRGTALHEGAQAFFVSRFVEKPDRSIAENYLSAGDYYWNSGIFAFRADTFLAELEHLEPDLLARCQGALKNGIQDLDFLRLEPEAFDACKSISIDYAVMEHTRKAAMVPVEMDWNDIGSWEALWASSEKDSDGNAVRGDVLLQGSTGSYLRSEGPMVAAVGLKNIIVVATPDAVLVGSKSAAQDVKKIVDQLERDGRDLHVAHRGVLPAMGKIGPKR